MDACTVIACVVILVAEPAFAVYREPTPTLAFHAASIIFYNHCFIALFFRLAGQIIHLSLQLFKVFFFSKSVKYQSRILSRCQLTTQHRVGSCSSLLKYSRRCLSYPLFFLKMLFFTHNGCMLIQCSYICLVFYT